MKTFLLVLVAATFWFVSTLIMIGLSAGLGFFLHWIWPQVEPGAWILVSLIAGVLSIRLLLRILAKMEELEYEKIQDEEQEKELIITELPLRLPFMYRPRKKRPSKRKTGD
jgi:hypothetical protein